MTALIRISPPGRTPANRLLAHSLPEDKTYTVRVPDTRNMTDEAVAKGVSGRNTVKLPGRENMAVLAIAEKEETYGKL